MPTFSDGDDSIDAHLLSDMSADSSGDMRQQLQSLIDKKEEELQQAGVLGQQLLSQRMELEERVRLLQELDADSGSEDEDIGTTARERYRELADTIKAWDEENLQVTSTFGVKPASVTPLSPASRHMELARSEVERSLDRSKASGAGPSAAQSSRRAKNAAHRADDVEFAFEIGSGLLTEVRRLQSLLAERDKAIQDMKEEKDDLEKSLEGLRTTLQQQEQSADKFKEENWNLEVTLQELRKELGDSQAAVQRLEGEHKRLTKMLTAARETADQHKNEAERQHNAYAELKAKHETDVAQARKNAASLQRDKSDLQQALDAMKVEATRSQRRFPRFGTPLTPNGSTAADANTAGDGDEDDVFAGTGMSSNRKKNDGSLFPPEGYGTDLNDSPDVSPSKPFLSPNHPNNEIEALQQRLAHAQRQISTLKGTLQREKELRMEYRRKLDASPGYLIEEEDDEIEQGNVEKPKVRVAPHRTARGRGRGRGRSRGGFTLLQRLGMAAASPSSDFADDDDDDGEMSPPPLSVNTDPEEPPTSPTEEEGEVVDGSASPSPVARSNRTSVDGMDPVFANVLKRSASQSSQHGSSPLRTVTPRAGTSRRLRGGAAFQLARPPSLAAAPEALASELGLGASSLETSIVEETVRAVEVETAEFACQTEPESIQLKPDCTDMAIQVEPEPMPETMKSDASTSTESLQAVTDMSTQTPSLRTTEIDIQTVSDSVPARVDSDAQTISATSVEMEVQTMTHQRVLSPVRMTQETQTSSDDDMGNVTVDGHLPDSLLIESGFEHIDYPSPYPTTDTEAYYTDAPQSLVTPTDSTDDFHSIRTVSDNDYSSGSDVESIRTSGVGVSGPPSAVGTAMPSPPSFTKSMPTYEDKVIETEVVSIAEAAVASVEEAEEISPVKTTYEDKEIGTDVVPMKETAVSPIIVSAPLLTADIAVSPIATSFASSQIDVAVSPIDVCPPPLTVKTAVSPIAESHAMLVEEATSPIAAHAEPPRIYEDKETATEVVEETKLMETTVVEPVIAKPVLAELAIQTDPELVPEPTSQNLLEPISQSLPLLSKSEVKEISIQTDDWVPQAPVAAPPSPGPVPVPPLFRVSGSNQQTALGTQQFQFISPPSSAGPTTTTTPNIVPHATVRDSTFIPRPRTSNSDRRQSIESAMSPVIMDDVVARSRTPSTVPNVIDKSRPPMMVLPPPPRQPPPPGSMPPPNFIPEKRVSHDIPPGRPSSPPPPELIQRATSPTFGAALGVPGGRPMLRQYGASVPTQQDLRQPPSTSSFRSAANAAARAPISSPAPSAMSFSTRDRERREMSSTSLGSGRQSVASMRSSMSSADHMYDQHHSMPHASAAVDHSLGMDINGNGGSTDPTVIHAITQTMIGEFLYKYTRRALGKGHGTTRHRRFFWVHPYTRTLYWSSADPGSSNVSESSAKSAYIEGVRAVLDPNPMPPGIHQYSVVVSTPQREMKFTAPTKERHDIWLNALQYLLTRPNPGATSSPAAGAGAAPLSPMSMDRELPDDDSSPQVSHIVTGLESHRSAPSARSALSAEWNSTPRGQRSHSQLSMRSSMGKRSGTPAAEYLRWTNDNLHSPTREYEHIPAQDNEELDFELHDETLSDGDFEGLENVRACCDGRHTVGRTGKVHHHHHHHNNHPPQDQNHDHVQQDTIRARDNYLDAHQGPARPASPAWSFRSRAGSTNSRDGGSFFSKFGSRRSTRPTTPGIPVGGRD